MDKKYIAEYGKLEQRHWWFRIRKKIILQTLKKYIPADKKNTPLRILNIGAASGASSIWLSQLGDVTSVEYDESFLAYLQEQNFPVTHASITALPFDENSFDLVCAFDVVEHVQDDQQAIDELMRVCKMDGKICITVPAFQSLWGDHDVINDHYRRYKKNQLQQLFKNRAATTLYASYFNTLLFPFIFLFRKITGVKKDKNESGSDFDNFTTNAFINKLLEIAFGVEPFLLKFMKFSFGVSLLMLIQKNNLAKNSAQ